LAPLPFSTSCEVSRIERPVPRLNVTEAPVVPSSQVPSIVNRPAVPELFVMRWYYCWSMLLAGLNCHTRLTAPL
jgi:hypothetical protein